MAWLADPYRVLGVPPGAGEGEIKRAYRRLVKRYHPDSAGEAATERFLQIQAAYEALLGKRAVPGRRSSAGQGWAGAGSRGSAWWAARGGDRWAGSGTNDGAGRWGGEDPRREGRGQGGRAAGGDGREGAGRPRSGGAGAEGAAHQPRHGRRWRRTATLGSTSYDEALAGPPEARWEGASWYGVTTGTYWTINPREYADPRKHGPEYQERARRALGRDNRSAAPSAASPAAPRPAGLSDAPGGRDAEAGSPSRVAGAGLAPEGASPKVASQRAGAPPAVLVPVTAGLALVIVLLAGLGAGAAILLLAVGAGGLVAVAGLLPRRRWGGG
jgi:hypothetical protein